MKARIARRLRRLANRIDPQHQQVRFVIRGEDTAAHIMRAIQQHQRRRGRGAA